MTTEQALDELITREGGFVNDPLDVGGPTKFGITRATLAVWKGHDVTIEDVRQLSVAEAKEIYRQKFVRDPGYGAIRDEALRALVVDAAANHGPRNATTMLQRAVGGLVPDGVLGPVTIAAVNAVSPTKLWLGLFGQRVRFYGRIVTNNPGQAKFAAGWANRLADLLAGFLAA